VLAAVEIRGEPSGARDKAAIGLGEALGDTTSVRVSL